MSERSTAGRIGGQLAVLALVVLCLTWLLRLLLGGVFELNLDHRFWLRDYLGNLALTLLCYLLIRDLTRTLLLAGFVIVGFQISNGIKLVVLGTPASPDDFINIRNLFFLTEGLPRIAMGAILVLPIVLLLWFTRWRSALTWSVLVGLAVTVLLVGLYSQPLRIALDQRFGNSVWNQPENFARRGLALHIVQESIRTVAKVGSLPSDREVETALSSLATNAATGELPDKRNVHVFVLESFFDPVSLGPEWVTEDPFPASFRDLWAETKQSTILSPVFGGYTANAEFEVLCGFPVTENAVFFEGWLRRPVPCLPSVLAKAGYRTVASHPNVAGFWNRTHAYRLTGFDEYISKSSFDTTDSVGSFLLDHSYYEQLFDLLGPLDEQPIFNYMLTYHGHLPYPNSEDYPDQVAPAQDAPLLNGYLNHLWYKSRDLMAELERLRSVDPDALIVIFGDHLPFLGPNYGVYSEFLDLPKDRKAFSGEMLEFLVQTPLIVIDGERGALDLGQLPLYRLPALILELLGTEQRGMFAWTENPDGQIVRPVYGMHIRIDEGDGSVLACPPESNDGRCSASADWLARTRTLIADIFTGKQLSLSRLGPVEDS